MHLYSGPPPGHALPTRQQMRWMDPQTVKFKIGILVWETGNHSLLCLTYLYSSWWDVDYGLFCWMCGGSWESGNQNNLLIPAAHHSDSEPLITNAKGPKSTKSVAGKERRKCMIRFYLLHDFRFHAQS
ncbi:unnamed protein product [Coffea canephora]|uniref:Uncharacterized protein n=1 Tax=Coffea canephora TaxID=49390 RepID=A0A068TMA3_COFCA|nr:unnamed protein product [Coffea canephora]